MKVKEGYPGKGWAKYPADLGSYYLIGVNEDKEVYNNSLYYFNLYDAEPKEVAVVCKDLAELLRMGFIQPRTDGVIKVENFIGSRSTTSRVSQDFLSVDVFNPYADPPEIVGWVCVQGKRTKGGNHQWYDYMREGTVSLESLARYLKENPATENATIEVARKKIKIKVRKPYSIGPWIGRGGRWARAYKRLGLNVKFIQA